MTGSRPSDEALRIHRSAILVDGHCDTPFRLLRHGLHLEDSDPTAQVDLNILLESGITASFFVSYVPPYRAGRGAAEYALAQIDRIHSEVQRNSEHLDLVIDASGIETAHRAGRVAVLIGVEGGHAIEDSLDVLDRLYRRGTRYMTLTHVNTNNWADSSGDEERHGGLTEFGRSVVRRMNEIGMIVDISHVSDQTFEQVLDTSRVPVIASHSSCRALTNHKRNLTDDMLRALGRAGGVCMINFFSAFISEHVARALRSAPSRDRPQSEESEEIPDDRGDWDAYVSWFSTIGARPATLDDVVDHIVHAIEVAGVEHVGIGTDFDGVPDLPQELGTARAMPLLTQRLLDRGLDERAIRLVYGENFLRVFRSVEAGKTLELPPA